MTMCVVSSCTRCAPAARCEKSRSSRHVHAALSRCAPMAVQAGTYAWREQRGKSVWVPTAMKETRRDGSPLPKVCAL